MATEKHNIDILVAADNINILNVLSQILPGVDDPRLWNVEYGLSIALYRNIDDLITFEGANILRGHICFENIVERSGITASLRASQGLFNQCKEGSYIRLTTNNHAMPIEQRTSGDKIENQYGKDSIGIYTEDFIEGISQGRQY